MTTSKKCSAAGCQRNIWARGLCRKHFTEANASEADVEKACKRLATAAGWLFWKLRVIGLIGVPDRMLLRDGKVFFVEFKKPGERARESQIRVHDLLRRYGFDVYVVDRVSDFKRILSLWEEDPTP